MPKIQYDASQVLKKMQAYQRVTGKEVSQQVKNWSAYFAGKLAESVAPFGFKRDAKLMSEKAITKDVRSLFVTLNDYWFEQYMATMGRGEKTRQEIKRKDGTVFIRDTMRAIESYGEAVAFHKASRTGKRRRPSTAGTRTRDVGRHKASSVGVAKIKDINKIIKELSKRVGFSKAAWITTSQKLGADTKKVETLRGIPAWVKRHVGKVSGYVQDKTNNPTHPHMRFNSGLSYMSDILPQKRINEVHAWSRVKFVKALNAAIRAELKKAKA